MNYYIVNAVGDGTDESPITPDIPAGVSSVGWAKDGTYLIAASGPDGKMQDVTPLTGTELEAECALRGLSLDDVKSWMC